MPNTIPPRRLRFTVTHDSGATYDVTATDPLTASQIMARRFYGEEGRAESLGDNTFRAFGSHDRSITFRLQER